MADFDFQSGTFLTGQIVFRLAAPPFFAEMMTKLFEVGVHHKRRLIERQWSAVNIQNAATHSRHSHGAHGLGFLVFHVHQRGCYLHIPETSKEQGCAQEQTSAHVVHAGVSIALGSRAIHGIECLAQCGLWCRRVRPEVVPPRIDLAIRAVGKRARQKFRFPESRQTIARV